MLLCCRRIYHNLILYFWKCCDRVGCWYGRVHIVVNMIFFGWINVGLLCMHVAFDCGFRNWIIFGQLVYSQFRRILKKTVLITLHQVENLERIRRHGKNKCSFELMRHLCLNFLCGLIVGKLVEKMNKEVVMVHCSDLELWVDKAY